MNRRHSPESVVPEIKALRLPAIVEIAPGKFLPRDKGAAMPDYTMACYQQNPDGTYSLKPVLERMARLDDVVLRKIGLPGMRLTLTRLGRAGFVELVKIAPRTTMLNLDSWYNHVARCAEAGEEFWNEERVAEYQRAM